MRCLSCLILVVLSLSCTSTSTPVAETPRAAFGETSAPASGPNCVDETFCTREYLPTTCQYKGQSFDGSNPCEAKRLAKRYACENSVPFADAAMLCKAKDNSIALAGGGAAKNCGPVTYCTQEMNPHNCVYGGENFRGNNRCEALKKVRTYACERGLVVDEKTLVCAPAKGGKGNPG